MEYRLPPNKYPSMPAQAQFHREVVERISAIPGVTVAASVRALPFSGNGNSSSYRLAAGGEPRTATINTISPGYFEALRIPLLAGRGFAPSEGGTPVVVVSRSLASRAWPGEGAIGRDLYFDEVGIVARVIGVVGDITAEQLGPVLDRPAFRWLNVALPLAGAALTAVIAWQSVLYAFASRARGEATNMLKIDLFPFQILTAASMALFCVVLLIQAWRSLRR